MEESKERRKNGDGENILGPKEESCGRKQEQKGQKCSALPALIKIDGSGLVTDVPSQTDRTLPLPYVRESGIQM